MTRSLAIVMAVAVLAGCSRNNENAHTTATTVVPPPPRQVLRAEFRPGSPFPFNPDALDGKQYDRERPILLFHLKNGETYREGQPVVIAFTLVNAKLKGDGGEYRVRYMVDDDDMQWIEQSGQVWLWGWLPGKHMIRVELIGADGWPDRNGDLNLETREITIVE